MPHRARDTSGYLRTQITRTMAAFASADVPFAVTEFGLQEIAHRLPRETITACDAGTDVAGPATIGRLQTAQCPANLPSPSMAGLPEKPTDRRR